MVLVYLRQKCYPNVTVLLAFLISVNFYSLTNYMALELVSITEGTMAQIIALLSC